MRKGKVTQVSPPGKGETKVGQIHRDASADVFVRADVLELKKVKGDARESETDLLKQGDWKNYNYGSNYIPEIRVGVKEKSLQKVQHVQLQYEN